jgi:hypothetical protein
LVFLFDLMNYTVTKPKRASILTRHLAHARLEWNETP